ncbi:MAG: glutaredoxin family protein [Candidatus Cloacimonetes bacterium]|nr:glutaredoxin family protein [Candidatus Cloacimonadota bacterium]
MEHQKSVIVFSTPTCGWCKKLKSYLKQSEIRFKDIDVSRDVKAAQDMMRKSGQQGVPQMWIDNHPVVGFDKKKIDNLLNIKKR